MHLRDDVFLGTTRSLCPACRRLVDAKIIVRQGRVYFRKHCPEHGLIEDFVCSDVAYYDRHEFSQPAPCLKPSAHAPIRAAPTIAVYVQSMSNTLASPSWRSRRIAI